MLTLFNRHNSLCVLNNYKELQQFKNSTVRVLNEVLVA